MAVQIPQRVLDGIWDRIDVRGPDECWPWKLSIGSHGYGQVGWGAKSEKRQAVTAHRAAWTAIHGPIPDGLTVDHLCRCRPCCNPAHLRLLTNVENARDNGFISRTHCPQGHPYDEANTRILATGHRQCKECNRRPQRAPIFGRICVECGGPIAPEKRAHAIYCSKPCSMRAGHRNENARKRAARKAA